MADKIEFFLEGTPPRATHQEKGVTIRFGKGGKPYPVFFDRKGVKEARKAFLYTLPEYAPDYPWEGAIRLETLWLYPRNGKHKEREPKITKPDTDNMIKLLKDCMTESGFWLDDAQVADERIAKAWSDTPGIKIRVERIQFNGKETEQ